MIDSVKNTALVDQATQATQANPATLVTLVDEQDRVVGQVDRLIAHQGAGLLHRAASIFIFRESQTGELQVLLQQRSATKIVAAQRWANTACGNCLPGESPLECIQRRLRQELGVTGVQPMPVTEFVYRVECEPGWCEFEYDHLFAGWYDGKITLNLTEAQAVEWVNWADLLSYIEQEDGREYNSQHHQSVLAPLAPWLPLFLTMPQVRKGLAEWLGAANYAASETIAAK